jgi:hypothetical protein
MHLQPLNNREPIISDVFPEWDGIFDRYVEMKEEVEERLKEAKGLLSGAHQLRLLLYIEARAMREYGWVI